MSESCVEQAARVAAFHQLTELLPGVTLEEWRRRCARWKARMSIWVVVGELRALIDRCAELEQRVEELERLVNVSRPCADNLEDTMKEAVERDHDPVNNVPGPTDEAKGDPGFLLQAARRLELAGDGDEDEPVEEPVKELPKPQEVPPPAPAEDKPPEPTPATEPAG